MWEFQVIFSLIVSPRKSNSSTRSMSISFILIFGISQSRNVLWLKWNNIYLVLETLRDNLLTANQSVTFFISLSIPRDIESIVCSWSKERETNGQMRVVSSAYVINVNFSEMVCISLTYKMKRSGPKMDPCGTPVLYKIFRTEPLPCLHTGIYLWDSCWTNETHCL